jgi:hypothetical protein
MSPHRPLTRVATAGWPARLVELAAGVGMAFTSVVAQAGTRPGWWTRRCQPGGAADSRQGGWARQPP